MWYKSYNIILNMQTFGAKCSPDVEIPPVLMNAFTVSHSSVTKGENVSDFH